MSLLHSALVQVLSNSPAESRSSNRFGWTIKNPRAFAAVSGSLHKLAPYLAWVCCPLIGFSPYSTCEVVTVCALQNISTSARADRSEQHRRLYTAAWRACQPGPDTHKNGQPRRSARGWPDFLGLRFRDPLRRWSARSRSAALPLPTRGVAANAPAAAAWA